MHKLTIRILLLTAALCVVLAAEERVMVGDDIFVGPAESLDNVVCIGCSIRVEGTVREAVAIGGNVYVDGGTVRSDLVAIAGSVELQGEADSDVVAVLGSVDLDGTVNGDVVSVLGRIEMRDGATINGSAVGVLSAVERGSDTTITGDLVETVDLKPIAISGAVIFLVLFLIFALALWPFVTFVCFAILGQQRADTLATTVAQRAGMCFLIGFGVWIGSLVLSVFVPFVFFWLPGLETIYTIAFLVVAAVGYTGVSLWVGRGLVKGGTGMGATILGSILITVIQLIPVIGWFIAWPIFGFLALGAAVVSGFGTSIDWLLPRSETESIARPRHEPVSQPPA